MKAENKTEDMIDILQHIQQYTPVSPQEKYFQSFLVVTNLQESKHLLPE